MLRFRTMARRLGKLRPEAWEPGYAVRRDWPDGSHDLVAFRWKAGCLGSFIRRDVAYWRPDPMRPDQWMVVQISGRDFDLHAGRRTCRGPDCPGGLLLPVHRAGAAMRALIHSRPMGGTD